MDGDFLLMYGAVGCIYFASVHAPQVLWEFLTSMISFGKAPFGPVS